MGGPGSMNQWHSNMLAQNDHIHFRSTGYALQGYLFANALMDAYNLNTTTPVSTESLSEYINRNAPVYYKPAVVAATVSTGSKYHIVKSGETLSGIARKYGTSVSKICTLSGIKKSRVIRPGQRLRVR
jgi:LysM repeat protein